jgi:hypothetical protein
MVEFYSAAMPQRATDCMILERHRHFTMPDTSGFFKSKALSPQVTHATAHRYRMEGE